MERETPTGVGVGQSAVETTAKQLPIYELSSRQLKLHLPAYNLGSQQLKRETLTVVGVGLSAVETSNNCRYMKGAVGS